MCVFSLFTLFEIAKNRHFGYAKFSTDANGSSSSCASSFKRHSCTRPLMGGRRSSSTDKESIKSSMIQPLTYLRRRADNIRQKQEFRASVSIILIILLYLLFHSLQVYNVVRKWQLILMEQCPKRFDAKAFSPTIELLLDLTISAHTSALLCQFCRQLSMPSFLLPLQIDSDIMFKCSYAKHLDPFQVQRLR